MLRKTRQGNTTQQKDKATQPKAVTQPCANMEFSQTRSVESFHQVQPSTLKLMLPLQFNMYSSALCHFHFSRLGWASQCLAPMYMLCLVSWSGFPFSSLFEFHETQFYMYINMFFYVLFINQLSSPYNLCIVLREHLQEIAVILFITCKVILP